MTDTSSRRRAADLLREHDPAQALNEHAVSRVAARLRNEPRPRRRLHVWVAASLVLAPVAFASLYRGVRSAAPVPVEATARHAAHRVAAVKHEAPAPLPPAPPSIADEARALEPAVRAVAAKDGAAARCALEAYARAFPHGALAPEADELRARAKGLPGSRTSCGEP
ncbi:MAG: hypothetical protein IPJ65_03280 [Archangiaceae bacterium]|nr:hypothetical protein [Archangiaceae bacterium]